MTKNAKPHPTPALVELAAEKMGLEVITVKRKKDFYAAAIHDGAKTLVVVSTSAVHDTPEGAGFEALSRASNRVPAAMQIGAGKKKGTPFNLRAE